MGGVSEGDGAYDAALVVRATACTGPSAGGRKNSKYDGVVVQGAAVGVASGSFRKRLGAGSATCSRKMYESEVVAAREQALLRRACRTAPAGEEAQAVDHTATLHALKVEAAKAHQEQDWTRLAALAVEIKALEVQYSTVVMEQG